MQTIRENRLARIGILVFAFIMSLCLITANTNDVYAAVKAPAQVKNVKLAGVTKTSVNVKWKKAARAKQYQVAYKTASAKKFKFVKTKELNKKLTNLKSGTKYTVKVRALNGKKVGKWSKVKTIKTKKAQKPLKVTKLQLSKKTETTLNVKWAKTKKCDSYQVAYKKVGAKNFTIVKAAKNTKVIKNLKPGTKYVVKVRGVNGSNRGKWSAAKQFKTKVEKAPAVVQNVQITNEKDTVLKITWDKAANAKKYQIGYRVVGADAFTFVTTTDLEYTLDNLTAGTKYQIKVRGQNIYKYGLWCNAKSVVTSLSFDNAVDEKDVVVSATDDNIIIEIADLGKKGTATLYSVEANEYLEADPISGIVEENVTGTKVGTFAMNKAKTFKLDRMDAVGGDRLYDKYYVVADNTIVKGPIYTTSVDPLRDTKVEMDVPSKKGLVDELGEGDFAIMDDLGANWTAMNIDFTELILANETKDGKPIDNSNKNADTIEVNGNTYYIDYDYVSHLDSRLSRYEKMGINVVGICISFVEMEKQCQYPRALKYIDDARWTNGFNTSNELGRDYFIAGMEYLANRYSKGGKGLICNYVIGNEIDYAYDWNEVIPNVHKDGKTLPPRGSKYLREGEIETTVSLDTYMEEYSRALRLANLAVKKYSDDINVSVSLSKEWTKSKGEQQNALPDTNKRVDSYRPKEILDWLNYYTKKQGDFNWAITPHNYPVANGNAAAIETGLKPYTDHEDDKEAEYKVVVTGSYDDTLMMTQTNMEVLQMYLDQPHNQYRGTSRYIYLTENGSSSGSDIGTPTVEMQIEQAAAIAQHYYRAASLPSVKSIIYYKIQDRAEEGATSYKLGLFDTNGAKKLSYNMYKYIDTNRSFEISEQYLKGISFKRNGEEFSVEKGNIKSWRDVMEIVDSGYDWDKHWNEESLMPVKLESTTAAVDLKTDKTEYGADDAILVKASGSTGHTVGLYKKGDTPDAGYIYGYEIDETVSGTKMKSGKEFDIRAYGTLNQMRKEDAKLTAGDYTVMVSSGKEVLKSIDIKITGTSEFASKKTVKTNKTTYKVGEDIIITASGEGLDWVGIYKEGSVPGTADLSHYWYHVESGTQISGKPYIVQRGEINGGFSEVIPAGRYFVGLYENDGYNELARTEIITIEAGSVDTVEKLTSIEYNMENATDGFANGTVTVTKSETSEATDCLMYWGDANGKPLEGYAHLAKFKLTDTKTTDTMQANTIIPPGAKTLLAYAVQGGKQSAEPVVYKLPEGADYTFESESNEVMRFAVGSDLHLVVPGEYNDMGRNTNHYFTAALKDVINNLPGTEHFFVNGDIANSGKAGEFKVAMELIQNVEGAPTMHMSIGNHDWRTGNPNGQFQKYVSWFNSAVETETVYYDEWVDGYHFIYLGGEVFGNEAKGFLGAEQLEWLEELLEEDSEKDQDKPIFLFLHQGLQDSMAGNYIGQWGYSYGVSPDAKLKKIVQKYGQVIMFGGHTHYELDTDNSMTPGSEEFPVSINTASVGYLWDAYNTQAGEDMDGSHGYHVKMFKDNKIYMFGRNFLTGEYMPSAMYVIDPVELTVENTKVSMEVGDGVVNVGAKTEAGMPLTYKTSNSKVATVDYKGNIRAVAPGTAKIYISAESTKTKTINRKIVTVTVE